MSSNSQSPPAALRSPGTSIQLTDLILNIEPTDNALTTLRSDNDDDDADAFMTEWDDTSRQHQSEKQTLEQSMEPLTPDDLPEIIYDDLPEIIYESGEVASYFLVTVRCWFEADGSVARIEDLYPLVKDVVRGQCDVYHPLRSTRTTLQKKRRRMGNRHARRGRIFFCDVADKLVARFTGENYKQAKVEPCLMALEKIDL
ncbi:hypothetical protein BCR33DRAFT_727859 [Rhizoclosmatium globosum]|uniref:Uncharacterized protein n=1 Tax=Rhizoclosmatium globosum TaxID=329046 RepID=A0A1Y2AMT9_9FUNG|nr:hypothetical protein BCR33DRAFT_727859 [Rhizoclosmatium globosum]|eukprot:ORY23888.1 hypothetical protein BCR33DRAFT_727859 [Rhizoclosmatium globosum]